MLEKQINALEGAVDPNDGAVTYQSNSMNRRFDLEKIRAQTTLAGDKTGNLASM